MDEPTALTGALDAGEWVPSQEEDRAVLRVYLEESQYARILALAAALPEIYSVLQQVCLGAQKYGDTEAEAAMRRLMAIVRGEEL